MRSAVRRRIGNCVAKPHSELPAFRKAMKTAADSFRSGSYTQAEVPEWAFFSRVGQLFPESAIFGTSRAFLERASCLWNESAVFGTSRSFLERVGQLLPELERVAESRMLGSLATQIRIAPFLWSFLESIALPARIMMPAAFSDRAEIL
jgi:hypothetical protein